MHVRAALCACLLPLSACAAAPSEKPAKVEQEGSLSALLGGSLLTMGRADGEELARAIAEAERHPLGSQDNPVRVSMPEGQRAYLARLRCANDRAPAFQRSGNGGSGVFGSIVDIYDVRCANSEPGQSVIWMDMYHPEHREAAAPPGFTIVSE